MIPEKNIQSFLQLLSTVDQQSVTDDYYCSNYFSHLLKNGEYYLTLFHQVLNTVVLQCKKQPHQICLIDFGCGNGWLGLYAKYCGFNKVVLIDNNEVFATAALNLSRKLNIDVEVICGDENQLTHFRADALVATDVMEHIYDLPQFLQSIDQINSNLVTVFTTASNPWNPMVVKKLKALQIQDEWHGNKGGDLMGDAHPSYHSLREKIIRTNMPDAENIENLVMSTRGLAGKDLHDAVINYTESGRLPKPAPGVNTCHPITGSWTERIYSTKEIHTIFTASEFDYEISPGFYNTFNGGVKSVLKKVLNVLISIFGKRIAPWIMISRYKK
jgi:2-polyprenyl-3-methyl-5-hydroxy-6-metoxy-1,4-benzoquinol methylase